MDFRISDEAAAWIVEQLGLMEREPGAIGLVPGLYFVRNSQSTDDEGRIFESCQRPYFAICWHTPEVAAAYGFIEHHVLGRKLMSPRETFEMLDGRELVLMTVEVGWPIPAAIQCQQLRAVPEIALQTEDNQC